MSVCKRELESTYYNKVRRGTEGPNEPKQRPEGAETAPAAPKGNENETKLRPKKADSTPSATRRGQRGQIC